MTTMVTVSTGIAIPAELWNCSVMPEGILERWLVTNGARVNRGDAVATVRIEDALHEVLAPATGRFQAQLDVNNVVEPGTIIGQVSGNGPEHDHFQLEV